MSKIKLSKRMQTVAGMVEGDAVADIGCDHAFVSIYLVQAGLAKKVIAMDVKNGPVDIAKNNIATYGMTDKIEVRLSNGFQKLHVGEADCAVIAGMGGLLMIDILEKGHKHLEHGINLVLQPQSDIPLVRKYLLDNGYAIEDEEMLIEDGKYYTAIKAKHLLISELAYNDVELWYGRKLLEKKDVTLKQYLQDEYEANKQLLKKLNNIDTDKSKERIVEIQQENVRILSTLQELC